jgi:hypothetical protein
MPTPDTTAYLLLGLGVTFGALGLFVLSMWARMRSARRDFDTIHQISHDDK